VDKTCVQLVSPLVGLNLTLVLAKKLLEWIKTLHKHPEGLILAELQGALLPELQAHQQYK
jgi:hypothetical protein